MKIPYIQTTVT